MRPVHGSVPDGSHRHDAKLELAAYSRDELLKDLQWLGDNNENVRQESSNFGAPRGGGKAE